MGVEATSTQTVNVARDTTWMKWYMYIFGAPDTLQFRELAAADRQYLHFYFLWVKYHVVATLYHQHSIPYNLVQKPHQLRFWLRALAPLTPLFGGTRILEHNVRYTLFCNMLAIGRGCFWVLPVILWSRHTIKSHPDREAIVDYLRERNIIGQLIIPSESRVTNEEARTAQYEYYLKRGLQIPQQFMPKNERERRKMEESFNPEFKMDFASSNNAPDKPKNRETDRMTRRSTPFRNPTDSATFIVSDEQPSQRDSTKKKTWTEWLTGR